MKKEEKKLRLNKVTIRDLQANLDRDAQKNIRGGSGSDQGGTGITCLIVIC